MSDFYHNPIPPFPQMSHFSRYYGVAFSINNFQSMLSRFGSEIVDVDYEDVTDTYEEDSGEEAYCVPI